MIRPDARLTRIAMSVIGMASMAGCITAQSPQTDAQLRAAAKAVSVADLAAAPEHYDGQWLSVSGWLEDRNFEPLIFAVREGLEPGVSGVAAIGIVRDEMAEPLDAALDGKRVAATGKFDATCPRENALADSLWSLKDAFPFIKGYCHYTDKGQLSRAVVTPSVQM